MSWIVGCDTGGTFTDVFAVSETGESRVAKVPSTPPRFDLGVVEGVRALGIEPVRGDDALPRDDRDDERGDHAATARHSALVTTRGLPRRARDPARQPRGALRHPLGSAASRSSARRHRLEIDERVDYAGAVVTPLDEDSVRAVARKLRAREIESVARLPDQRAHEPGARAAGAGDPARGAARARTSRSRPTSCPSRPSSSAPRRPSRTPTARRCCATTWTRSRRRSPRAGFKADVVLVMHNGGGTMTTDYAKGVAVKTLNSGPAAGVIAAAAVAASAGPLRTSSASTWAARAPTSRVVRDGEPQLDALVRPRVGHADPLPEHRRRLDRRRRRLDRVARPGRLSAQRPAERRRRSRARPATARAARSRRTPTRSSCSAGSATTSSSTGAWSSTPSARPTPLRRTIAEPLGLSLEDAAEGVLRIANANMVKAIRLVTVERGLRPARVRARRLRRRGRAARRRPGARAADARGDRPALPRRDERDGPALRRPARRLLLGLRPARARDRPRGRAGASTPRWRSASWAASSARASQRAEIAVENAVDIRYVGQLHSVTVPLPEISRGRLRGAPSRASTTSTCASTATRIPNRRSRPRRCGSRARGRREKPDLSSIRHAGAEREALRRARAARCTSRAPAGSRHAVLDRTGLTAGDAFDGPCIVEELDSTVVLPPGTSAAVDAVGNIVISLLPDSEVSR